MKKGSKCKICGLVLTLENSYIKHTENLLCRTHYNQLKNSNHTEVGRKARDRYIAKASKLYPEKWAARVKVRYAIKTGKIIRLSCEVCGNEKTDAHHDDYSKPFDVRWLCRKHHAEVHRIKRKLLANPTH